MAAEYHCLIHGLVVASEVVLPLPRIRQRAADITYRRSIGAVLPDSTYSRVNDPDHPWAVEHWTTGHLAVEFPERATFQLSRTEVVLVADHTHDPDLVIHLLLDHVLPRIIAMRGDLMLHAAGAVGPSDRAHLFLGPTGAGKSTVVTSLVTGGWSLLDDDGVRVVQEADSFHAMPGAPNVRLLPDTAAALVPSLEPGVPISAGSAKRRFAADGVVLRMAHRRAVVAGIYVVARVETTEPSVERLGFAEALGTISEHGFHLADEPTAIAQQAFERASALAAAAPVWRLSTPTGLSDFSAIATLLARLDGGR